MKQKTSRGFTLIELLVVIAIIGILASIVLVSLSSARTKARDARRISDIKQIALALETYFSDNAQYPSVSSVSSLPLTTYMPGIPADPYSTATGPYRYAAQNTAGTTNCAGANIPTKYHLAAGLENAAADGTGSFAGDADAANYGATVCSTSAADFHGRSTVSGGIICADTTNLSVGSVESCYDVTN